MQALPYTTKGGARQFRPRVSLAELDQDHDTTGFCLACGHEAEPVEPDARRVRCHACGAHKVYGFDQLAIMGLVLVGRGPR